jgi:osmotically inducible lipoprotein OsmB
MNRIRLLGAAVLPALLACGCSNLSHTENGALAGGAIGAGTGALIGKATGHTAGGAAIGAGIGALTGGLIGNSADQTEKRIAAAQAQSQLGLNDVVQMAQSHVSDEIIINQIRTRGTVFHLSAQDTIWLKQNGVSDRVLAEMQATATRYVPGRVYSAAPVYVVDPPPVVGVGIGYTHYGRHW